MALMNHINTQTVPSAIANRALQIAQAQIGQCEQPTGSNSGPMVDAYLKSVGLNPGYAWCQAFVHWCYESAAQELGMPNPVIKTAAVHDCWNRSTGRINKVAALQDARKIIPGDQFILFLGKNAGHTGIVEGVEGDVIYTIEGNSNTTGSREGYAVVRHQRSLDDKALQGFIKYS